MGCIPLVCYFGGRTNKVEETENDQTYQSTKVEEAFHKNLSFPIKMKIGKNELSLFCCDMKVKRLFALAL